MQQGLFISAPSVTLVNSGGHVVYHPQFIDYAEVQQLMAVLQPQIAWEQPTIRIHGVDRAIPRLNAWYGEPGAHYGYSNVNMTINPWTPILFGLKQRIEAFLGALPEYAGIEVSFNSVLLNLYRNGQDSVSWHADNERELGVNPLIASLSLGAERDFHLKPTPAFEATGGGSAIKVRLESGSLLTMGGQTQANWLHAVPKSNEASPRINLTFRKVVIKHD